MRMETRIMNDHQRFRFKRLIWTELGKVSRKKTTSFCFRNKSETKYFISDSGVHSTWCSTNLVQVLIYSTKIMTTRRVLYLSDPPVRDPGQICRVFFPLRFSFWMSRKQWFFLSSFLCWVVKTYLITGTKCPLNSIAVGADQTFFLVFTFKEISMSVCRFRRLQAVSRLVIYKNLVKRKVLWEENIRTDVRTECLTQCICFHWLHQE